MKAEDLFDLFQKAGGNPEDALDRMLKQLLAQYGDGLHQLVDDFCGANYRGKASLGHDDAYRVLGLDSSATDIEVKRRYRELAKKLHPDVAGEESVYLFKLVQSAYEDITRRRGWR